jgi:hypothetical protein
MTNLNLLAKRRVTGLELNRRHWEKYIFPEQLADAQNQLQATNKIKETRNTNHPTFYSPDNTFDNQTS